LVGTSTYSELPGVPAAANSLARMQRLLTGPLCQWPTSQVTLVPKQRLPGDLPDRLIDLYKKATDVALFYYVGHGQIDDEGELCLGLADSRRLETERRATTSLTFNAVRRALRASPASIKVIILDCCFAGQAVHASHTLAGQEVDVPALTGGTGAYILAATGPYSTAWFESDQDTPIPHTYFTKHFAEIVERGIPGEPTGLTLDPIYRRLREDLPAAGKPAPTRSSRDNADTFLFARNAAPRPPEPAASANTPPGGDRDRIVLNAYEELTVAERRWARKFGLFGDARDLAAGIIEAADSGHINRGVLLDATERLAIRTPRYWLAHATVAVAAWLDDRPEQHDEALGFALALDPSKTALFMALVLLRLERDEVPQEWLDEYLSRLDRANLPPHFQVVIDGVTGGALGGVAALRLVQRMADWYKEAEGRQDISDAVVGKWKQRLLSLGARDPEQRVFPLLATCPEWQALGARHAANCAIAGAARHFRERFETGADVSAGARESLATLVNDLARTPDPSEEKDLRAIREAEAVIETRGDLAAARALVAAEEAGRTGTLNIVSMMSSAAFPVPYGGQLPEPTVTELLAIMLSGRLIAAAADSLREELPHVESVGVTVGERQWQASFSCASGGDVTHAAMHRQADEQAKKVCDQIQKDFSRHKGRQQRPKVVRRAADRAEEEKRAVTGHVNEAARQLADLWDADRLSASVILPELGSFLRALTDETVIAAIRPVRSLPLPLHRTREFPSWTPRPPRQQP